MSNRGKKLFKESLNKTAPRLANILKGLDRKKREPYKRLHTMLEEVEKERAENLEEAGPGAKKYINVIVVAAEGDRKKFYPVIQKLDQKVLSYHLAQRYADISVKEENVEAVTKALQAAGLDEFEVLDKPFDPKEFGIKN